MIDPYALGYLARGYLWWNPWVMPMLLAASVWMSGYADACADAVGPVRREDLRLEPECRRRVA